MTIGEQPPTVGQAFASLTVYDVGAYGSLLLVIIGSIAPWATSPLSSAAGTTGDGKLTIGLALAGMFTVWRGGPTGLWIGILAVIIGAIGVYDIGHVHHIAKGATFEGIQLVHVGWGLDLLVGAAVASLVVNIRAWRL